MQFRILPVAVALLAVVVVVLAADPPTADIMHSKNCYHNHDKKWHVAEGEEVDEEAMKAYPSNYEAMGWRHYKSGKCTYKRKYVDCPHKKHWHHDENHWDREHGFKRLNHPCTENKECCSEICLQVRNSSASGALKVCCAPGALAWNATCIANSNCCSGKCANVTVGGAKYCQNP